MNYVISVMSLSGDGTSIRATRCCNTGRPSDGRHSPTHTFKLCNISCFAARVLSSTPTRALLVPVIRAVVLVSRLQLMGSYAHGSKATYSGRCGCTTAVTLTTTGAGGMSPVGMLRSFGSELDIVGRSIVSARVGDTADCLPIGTANCSLATVLARFGCARLV